MKFKELPGSLLTAWRLRRIPVAELGAGAVSAPMDIVVSLTSIESRLARLDLTIRSLLHQKMSCSKVVLWLNHSLRNKISKRLSSLEGERFEIKYSDETCSHRKLVETLRENFEQTVVTCDDDVMYAYDWLSRLVETHLKHKDAIVAHECRVIHYDTAGNLSPYSKWHSEAPGQGRPATLAIGYGGVLYPAGILPREVLERTSYDRLAPRADDLWFKAMSLKKGVRVVRTEHCNPKPVPVIASQSVSLKKHNVREDGNYLQWQALDAHYNLKELLINS